MDNELAEREAHLRNYGSLKPPKAIQKPVEAIAPLPPDNENSKTDNSVTNRNIPPDAPLIIPVKKVPGKQYPTAVCTDTNDAGTVKSGEAINTSSDDAIPANNSLRPGLPVNSNAVTSPDVVAYYR